MTGGVVTNETTTTSNSLRTNHKATTTISSGARRKSSAGTANGRLRNSNGTASVKHRNSNAGSSGNNSGRQNASVRISSARISSVSSNSAGSRKIKTDALRWIDASRKMAAASIRNARPNSNANAIRNGSRTSSARWNCNVVKPKNSAVRQTSAPATWDASATMSRDAISKTAIRHAARKKIGDGPSKRVIGSATMTI